MSPRTAFLACPPNRIKPTSSKKAPKRPTLQARLKTARQSSLEQWFTSVKATAESVAAAVERGACLVADPAGGPAHCVLTDRATCKTIKGTFLGGPC